MSGEIFRVVFQGQVKQGEDVAAVKCRLARLFKQPEARIDALFTGNPLVIKKGLDHQTAQRYRTALEGVGALCHMEEELIPVESPRPAAPSAGPAPRAAAQVLEPAMPAYVPGAVPSNGCGAPHPLRAVARPAPAQPEPPVRELTITFEPHAAANPLLPGAALCPAMTIPGDVAHVPPARLWKRGLAALASLALSLYVGSVCFTLAIPVGVFALRAETPLYYQVMSVVGMTLGILYTHVILPMRWHGMTYGQRLMGIAVIEEGPQPRTQEKAGVVLRLMGNVIVMGFYWLLVPLLPLLGAQRRSLPDVMSGSRQIETTPAPASTLWALLIPWKYALLACLAWMIVGRALLG